MYRDHEGWDFLPKISAYFVTSKQDWLGIAKSENVCITLPQGRYKILKVSYLAEFPLTDLLLTN